MKHTKETALGILFALSAIVSGCGQQPFMASSAIESQMAPGHFTIPAKVDFLLVEDDTGSMNEIYPQISGVMPGVLNRLETNKAWDYHFATIPLTTYRALNQVTASHYDANWGSEWIAPFPGATPFGSQNVNASVFRRPNYYTDFLKPVSFDNNQNGLEPGLQNIINSLSQMKYDGTNFLRDDALLVVLVVGNGDDTSGITYCDRGDTVLVPCGNYVSIDTFKTALTNIKGSSSLVRFYSAVSNRKVSDRTCQGSNAYVGTRYQQMSAAFKSPSYDICDGPNAVTAALDNLANDLTGVRLSLQTRYLPIAQRPDVRTIVVTRNDGVIIPQSATNGWTYTDVKYNGAYAIDKPVPMSQFSGYAIELHGTYKLIGDQTADVSYTPYGLQNSH